MWTHCFRDFLFILVLDFISFISSFPYVMKLTVVYSLSAFGEFL